MAAKRKVLWAIGAIVVVGAVVAAIVLASSGAATVEVADVTRGDLALTVAAAGSVDAEQRVDVYPPTAGVLDSVLVENGQEVHAGDVLAVMDTATMEAQVAQAQAAYDGAVAQRDAIVKSAPGASAIKAAQAAVAAAWTAYDFASKAYDAAVAGVGTPSASDIASAQAAVAVAQASADAAAAAYDDFYNNVYLPAPEPRDAALETTLAGLLLVKNQTAADLLTAQQGLAALMAASDNTYNIAQAKLAKDQAYAAYLAAVSQKDALAKAAGIGKALASADAAIEAARIALELATDALADSTIKAPVDGYVLFNSSAAASLTGVVSAPAAGMTVTPAAAPFAIVALDTLKFSAQIDEADIAQIEPGMTAVISLDALSDVEFEATVKTIGKESEMTLTGGTVFPVAFTFEAGDSLVLLGMNGSVDISVETVPDVIAMPVEALIEEGGTNYAYVVRDGRAYRTAIEIGQFTDTLVEVTSGLAEGDQVIVSGVSELSDGARVRAE